MKTKEWKLVGIIGLILFSFIAGNIVLGKQTQSRSKAYAISRKAGSGKESAIPAATPKPMETPKPEIAPESVNTSVSQSRPAVNSRQETAVDQPKTTVTASSTSDQNPSLQEILDGQGNPEGDGMTIVVQKQAHTLSLYLGNHKLKSYHVELGDNGLGDKEASGDHKTPEGIFYIAEKSVLNPPDQFLGTRWMRLSYPNIEDAQRGLNQGIINQETYNEIVSAVQKGETPPQNTALGGGVGIHGGTAAKLGPNWTWGCVGLTNRDVNEFYDYVKVGTPVVIRN